MSARPSFGPTNARARRPLGLLARSGGASFVSTGQHPASGNETTRRPLGCGRRRRRLYYLRRAARSAGSARASPAPTNIGRADAAPTDVVAGVS